MKTRLRTSYLNTSNPPSTHPNNQPNPNFQSKYLPLPESILTVSLIQSQPLHCLKNISLIPPPRLSQPAPLPPRLRSPKSLLVPCPGNRSSSNRNGPSLHINNPSPSHPPQTAHNSRRPPHHAQSHEANPSPASQTECTGATTATAAPEAAASRAAGRCRICPIAWSRLESE